MVAFKMKNGEFKEEDIIRDELHAKELGRKAAQESIANLREEVKAMKDDE